MRYQVTNILPASGTWNGITFSETQNRRCLGWMQGEPLPPMTREFDTTQVVGTTEALTLAADGSVTAVVDVPEMKPSERLGVTFTVGTSHEVVPAAGGWPAIADGERLILQIDALTITATPDPNGDMETITALAGSRPG